MNEERKREFYGAAVGPTKWAGTRRQIICHMITRFSACLKFVTEFYVAS